ncbi:MAG: NADH-ubiquinone oxidoreductase-F iron-sulfur binding region domain-containing protein [Desulfobaccales bacterium]
MYEQVLFKNRRSGRPATIAEYRAGGGYQVLADVIREKSCADLIDCLKESGLRGRGGAGFPTWRKWSFVRPDAPHPRYIGANTDEMEPGTYKDRVLVNTDPHLIIEGIILAGYAIRAQKAFYFIRPTYEMDAELIEGEVRVAKEAGFLGDRILGSDFSFDIVVHRSAGRYICGEATAMVQAIMGKRAHPQKDVHMTDKGLWDRPTVVNNAETLACVPLIIKNGGAWFKGLARTPNAAGTKLYCISGKVNRPGCYELPMGIPFREILENVAGGMLPGSELKAFIPGGASTSYMPPKFLDVAMDDEGLQAVGHRFGTGAIMVFDQHSCMVAATLNLMEYFARESCGFCTPCREGFPYIRDLLWRIEKGEGKEEYITMLREMAGHMQKAYCAFAPGAAEPLRGLLEYFEAEIREHISQRRCPFKEQYRPYQELWYPPAEA